MRELASLLEGINLVHRSSVREKGGADSVDRLDGVDAR